MKKAHAVDIVNITKEFGDVVVLDNISLYVRQNEFLTLLGPSGCGKTTTLRIIGGFEKPTEGKVYFDDKDITGVPAYMRQINTVFQRYALFPHLNVYENIAFGLKIKKISKKEIEEKVSNMLKLVNLSGFENRDIESLSGGQQQRIAIARALVNEPRVLLLDEPLGALDLKLRKDMQLELKSIQKRVGITFIYVTHDQEEALTMSDTIVVMDKGKIQQIGSPVDIYNEPINRFVAEFIGESNILDGIMKEDYRVYFANHLFECVDKGFGNNTSVDVVIRPEDMEIINIDEADLIGSVDSIIFKGVHYEMEVNTGDFIWTVHSTLKKDVGEKVGLKIVADNIHIMRKES